jgi:hypothetical protein
LNLASTLDLVVAFMAVRAVEAQNDDLLEVRSASEKHTRRSVLSATHTQTLDFLDHLLLSFGIVRGAIDLALLGSSFCGS